MILRMQNKPSSIFGKQSASTKCCLQQAVAGVLAQVATLPSEPARAGAPLGSVALSTNFEASAARISLPFREGGLGIRRWSPLRTGGFRLMDKWLIY